MVIYIGADHRGFKLKEYIKQVLASEGYEVVDVGNTQYDEADDYPDFAAAVAKKVSGDYENGRGILVCGSGGGMVIVANKFMKVHAVIGFLPDQVFDSRNDDDTNVLVLAADFLKNEEAVKIVQTWIQTPFSGEERFRRRLDKISQIELKYCHPVQQDEEET